jgi:tetratricopeptide (TPR) repeat protein
MKKKYYERTIGKSLATAVLALVAYLGLQYSTVLHAMDRAATLYSQGDLEGALKTYEAADQRLRAHGALRLIPSSDRQTLLLNEARLLYVLKRYDEAADRLAKEDEISGVATDGRFFLLRGNIAYRGAILNYQKSTNLDLNALAEGLLASEDSLRQSLQLNPNDWDAKYNFEFVDSVRKSLGSAVEGGYKFLKDVEPPPTPELPPELVS